MKKGCFVTVEGVEGVGKSTNIALVETLLTRHGINYIRTREPGGTVLSEKIRMLLLDREDAAMTDMTELLLVFAARVQHVEELILPNLARGVWVLCDRFTDSTFAYQGGGRGLPLSRIDNLKQLALGDFVPDLTLLLDMDVETALQRAAERGEPDRFEQEDAVFFGAVREQFLRLARLESERFRVIDASRNLEQVQDDIKAIMTTWIAKWQS